MFRSLDDRCECLRGQEVRKLLEACGATAYLKPMPIEPDFSFDELRRMRKGMARLATKT